MPFLKIGLSFATLQAFGKALEVIDRLQISLRGFARISAPSFKKFSKKIVYGSSFRNVDILYYFKNFLLRSVNALLLSTALIFEISVFCGMPRDFKVSHCSFSFPIFSENLSSKNARFFAAINFNVLYFAFLYSSLSI